MGLPIIGGLIKGASALAKAGVIRGSVGKLLGGGATKKATAVLSGPISSSLPPAVQQIPTIAGKILRGGASAAAGVGIAAAGSAVAGSIFGGSPRKRRRMNVTNQRALNRALRRVEGFQKLVKRSFSCTDLKPRKRRCR